MAINSLEQVPTEPMMSAEAAAPAPKPVTPDKGAKGGDKLQLPQQIATDPAIRMTLERKIPGVSFTPDLEGRPEIKPLEENAKLIQEQMGLVFYRVKSDDGAVMFNPLVISPKEVQAADKQKKIYEIFPNYGELTGISDSKPAPQGAKMTPPTSKGAPKATAKVRNQTQQARLKSMMPQLPPGMSQTLGSLQVPTV